MNGDHEQLVGIVREHVRLHVALAEQPAAAIVAATVEHLGDEDDPERVEATAWPVVVEELTAHLTAQTGWPESTDSDRLTAAFRALDAVGIVARENFACCQNCGLGEIGAEVPQGRGVRGYAFYHQQDAEHAVEGDALHVAYGSFEGPPTVELGEEVAAALRAEGLTVDWAGDPNTRIRVPMSWRRRRVGRLAALPATVRDDLAVDVEVLDGWRGLHAPADGPTSAARLAGLHLPWLPAGARLRLTHAAASVVVRREGDALVGAYRDGGEARVGRYDGVELTRRLVDLPDGGDRIPGPAGFLEVTCQHSAGFEEDVPLDTAETLHLLRRMRPLSRDFLTCVGRSGDCVQTAWEPDGLWVERLDTSTATSVGRYATLAEVERVLTVLAGEDRSIVDELGGLETRRW
ncbi:DUF6891 domain-containing protein [Micromonospora coxensis]|uniref:DUF6891 domain-containing protein n=1 Tax=Micromonospora coxensis TaxID=356852 RepID=A0A1C5JDB6_9ACTN|nr:hypothetical protein [Micromonospora coxensis]SCG68550.1 hypothetical protein GA0070614_4408 [Micromonospora coxensis]